MSLPTDIGLLEGFSGARSLHKIARGQKDQTRAIHAASTQASTDAERLRQQLDTNAAAQLSAAKERNATLVQQLQLQQQQLELQQQQVESQLRIEQSQAEQHALETSEDEMVSAMWQCVDEAKNLLRDNRFYSSFVSAVNARIAYGQLVPQSQKSDTKMKLGQLNDQACDILDHMLVPAHAAPLVSEGTTLLTAIKGTYSITDSQDASQLIEAASVAIANGSLQRDNTSMRTYVEQLKAFSGKLSSESEKLSSILSKLSDSDFALAPLLENSIQSFMQSHQEIARNLKQNIEKAAGISVDAVISDEDAVRNEKSKLDSLLSKIPNSIATIQQTIEAANNSLIKAQLRKLNWAFYLVLIGGFILVGIISNATNNDHPNAGQSFIMMLWLIASVSLWFVRRARRKKVAAALNASTH